MNCEFEVTAEKAFDKEDSEAILLKVVAAIIEVNIYIKLTSIEKLVSFHRTNQNYCLAGESANSPVHWKRGDDNEVYILIGEDQEVWNIGLTVDNDVIDRIIVAIRQLVPVPPCQYNL